MGRAPPRLPEPARQGETPIEGLVSDAGRHEPAVDHHLRRRDQDVRLRALGVDPAPEGVDIGAPAAGAEEGGGRRGHVPSGQGREREEGPARHRPGVEGEERDPDGRLHFTAPMVIPRRKYRWRARNTAIVGRVIRTAPAAMYRVLYAKRPER